MDLVKNLKLINMYEVYGNLLTEKQKQIFNLYVTNDLSLKEVSDILNISRQAVKYTLDNAVKSMQNYEIKLSFLEKIDRIKYSLNEIKTISKENEIKNKINQMLEDI